MSITDDMKINPLDSIDIRVGTEEDQEAVIEFSLSLSEDVLSSRDKWLSLVNNNNVYPLIAVYNQNIVGRLHAKIVNHYGWLENAKVSRDFRKMGIANTMVDAAMDWLISNGVEKIRTVIDSDNVSARKIIEAHHFSPQFLAINPTSEVLEEDSNPKYTSDFAAVLDEDFYPEFSKQVKQYFRGNIMVDGNYLPFTKTLFQQLIDERRVFTDQNRTIMLVLSKHNLPSEFHGFLVAKVPNGYKKGALALKAFAGRELSTMAICHAPTQREAVIGLGHANFGWGQPYSLIIYERESWQEREEK